MKSILLAAGKGERFFPFNVYRPKPMFPVANRPLLEWTVRRIVEAGITEIAIVTGDDPGAVSRHFGDGAAFGCAITFVSQPEPLGTADAALCASDFVGDDDVLVLLGDLYLADGDIPALLANHDPAAGSGAAAVQQVEDIERHVRATVDGSGHIADCVWKPRGGRGTALAGLYALTNQAYRDLVHASNHPRAQFGIAPPAGREIYDVISYYACAGRPLRAVKLDRPVLDMDYPWEPRTVSRAVLHDLAADLTESRVAETADVSHDANIDGAVVVEEGAIIHPGATVHGPAWIGRGTQVYEGSQIAAYTMIGDQCRIGPFAKVSGVVGNDCHITYLGEFGGVMLDGGRVTHQIQLSGIFGLGAEIGAGTQTGTLRFDDGPIEVIVQGRRRIAEGFSGILFGDYSRTGVGAMMMPGRIIGPCAMVGAGVVLMHNVPPHKAVLLEQNTRLVDWNPAIYDR